MSDENLKTITDVASEFGVTLRALRFYEDKGLLNPKRRGVVRLYDPAQRERVGAIVRAARLGFTLTQMKTVLRGATIQVPQEMLTAKISEQAVAIERSTWALTELKKMDAF